MTSPSPYGKVVPRPAPTAGERLRENIAFMIVGCFIIYLFQKFFEFLFKPLMTLGADDSKDSINESVRRKQVNRLRYLRRVAENVNDPMYQFSERFIEHPEDYKDDLGNDTYHAWYSEWKKGRVIDSTLRWAPDCLEDDDTMRPNFISYMKIQLDLHKKAPWLARVQFLNTIYRYYPELSASFKGLEEDLANYEVEATERVLKTELMKETENFGLPEELSGYLVTQDISPTEFKETALLLKKYSDQGYCPEACICAVENKVKSSEKIGIIHKVITELRLPAKVGLAYAREEMTEDELAELTELMDGLMHSKLGLDVFKVVDGESMYDGYIRASLQSYKANKRATLYT
jgi:hypothetical protein